MESSLACDKFWVNKNMYHDAEKKYYEGLAKGRLEILGKQNEEMSNQNLKKSKNCNLKKCRRAQDIDFQSVRKELFHLEAQKNVKNKIIQNDAHCFEIINRNGTENENFESSAISNNSEEKKQSKKRQKEVQQKKNKNEKKSKRTKENEDELPGGVGMAKIDQETFPKTSLAGEVAKARQHIKSSLECMESVNGMGNLTNPRLTAILEKMEKVIENLTKRVEVLERECATCKRSCNPQGAVCPAKPQTPVTAKPSAVEDEDNADVDLFGSDSEEDEEAKKVREQRLAEYAAKKSKKPGPIAKSNIILDIKPWDDETDMTEMEKAVRAIEMDGLIWGASKLVPVAFKIFKLQISCVIEDDKVSVDLLTENLEQIEDYIQSVDIAAFNKV